MARLARRPACIEDLCEAISLAHDLGHTPFGHAGQDALDEAYRAAAPEAGGFEHNPQSLRVVDVLESATPIIRLNPASRRARASLKHCSRRHAEALERDEPGGVGAASSERTQPSLEAQLANLADSIAYNAHDLDDGVRRPARVRTTARAVALRSRTVRPWLRIRIAERAAVVAHALRGPIAHLVDDTARATLCRDCAAIA